MSNNDIRNANFLTIKSESLDKTLRPSNEKIYLKKIEPFDLEKRKFSEPDRITIHHKKTNFDSKQNEENQENRFSDEFMKKLTNCTNENCSNRATIKLSENCFDNQIKIEEESNFNDHILLGVPTEEKSGSCLKFFLFDDFTKDIFLLLIDDTCKKGKRFLKTDINSVRFDDFSSIAYIVNYKDNSKFAQCLELIKEYQENSAKKLKVLIAGGDETIMNCIDDFRLNKVDLNRILFGVVPIGFNNNLSALLEFEGKFNLSKDLSEFKALVNSFSKGREQDIDIWKIELELEVK
jgi:hypothetical protein